MDKTADLPTVDLGTDSVTASDAFDASGCGEFGCVSAANPGTLVQLCTAAGSDQGFSGTLATIDSDVWRLVSGGGARGQSNGSRLVLETGEVASEGASSVTLETICEFPLSDLEFSIESFVTTSSSGDFLFAAGPDVSMMVSGFRYLDSSQVEGYALLVEDGIDDTEVAVPTNAWVSFSAEYSNSNTTVTADVKGGDLLSTNQVYDDPPATIRPTIQLSAFNPSTGGAVARATDAEVNFRNLSTDLVGALPAYRATHSPLTRNGVEFGDEGTRFYVDGSLSEPILSEGMVAGLSGSESLAAALVRRTAGQRITIYTDVDAVSFQNFLSAQFDAGSTLVAYIPDVFVGAGFAEDFTFDSTAWE
ncbi:MAG: hypothetical protein KC561_01635 [Myxococcales bacterium]|nr:hypothetical protein [Myxococcales bacterium]